ncbi:hypothetical protein LUX33_15050 [Actinomadura madurae]|uniref:hypothetical protein n=1 Tax=Actinomadura madurae TaxID=1993 RepID=UPI0020D24385|nr:hypothetical protein [Actinomadura madurae]MCP9949586.1 hypothetical protein [Actinomadura madurae]
MGTRRVMMKRALWEGLIARHGRDGGDDARRKDRAASDRRPGSYVPARVLERLIGIDERHGRRADLVNWTMHYGQGALVGVLRSVMAHAGLRGPWASAKFTVVRLTSDQILENATGVGAPPESWPRRELGVDLLHKCVYAFAAGAVADALASRSGPGAGQRHAAARPGRRTGVGPLPREHVRGS